MGYFDEIVEQLLLKSEYQITYRDANHQISLRSKNSKHIIHDVEKLRKANTFSEPIEILTPFELDGKGTSFGGSLNFSNCVFKKKFVLTNYSFSQEITFNDTKFLAEVDFSGSIFDKNVRFHRSEFLDKAMFRNTTFNSLVDFFLAIFNKDQQFHLTDFNDITIFSNTTFYGAVQFLHNKVSSNSYVSFESAEFYRGIDLSRSNFLCKLKFWGVIMHNSNFETICCNLLYMYDNETKTNMQNRETTAKKIRESLRMIKQSFRADHNYIEALTFQRLELTCYKYEISLSKHSLSDRALLWLNSISNSHGTSWVKGLKFTLAVTLFFYLIFLLVLSPDLIFDFSLYGIGNFLQYFIQLLNITNWKYQPFQLDTSPWGDILLYISRVFISYGYYQLIQSFRKYTKN